MRMRMGDNGPLLRTAAPHKGVATSRSDLAGKGRTGVPTGSRP